MNLVGPRPHPVSNQQLFVERIAFYSLRSAVLPGLTGWAQVRYRYANTLEEETEKMRHDLYYIKNRSLWLDLWILLATISIVFRGSDMSVMRSPARLQRRGVKAHACAVGWSAWYRDGAHDVRESHMKVRSLEVFVCPVCHGRFRLRWRGSGPEIMEGGLTCLTCGASYPITAGIPRFVSGEAYAQSFATQWRWFRYRADGLANGTSTSDRALRTTTGWRDERYAGRRVLDAGVGAGRFAERAAVKEAEVFGVDVTTAIDVAYRNIGSRGNVHLAQADIFALPFRDNTFDLAYSIGRTAPHTGSVGRVRLHGAGRRTARQAGDLRLCAIWGDASDVGRDSRGARPVFP